MNTDTKKRLFRTFVLTLIALCVGVGIGFYQISQNGARIGVSKLTPMAGSAIGGGFSLVGHDGKPKTEADYAGQYKLIYFGFTFCPAICPTELQKMSQALQKLPEDKANQIQPLFVTIDPERDTVEVMKSYVELFHPRMVGLTGSVEQIDQVKKDYRIFAAKVPDKDSPEDYTMDHSSYIYFMSPDNTLISIYHMKDDADKMVKEIGRYL